MYVKMLRIVRTEFGKKVRKDYEGGGIEAQEDGDEEIRTKTR